MVVNQCDAVVCILYGSAWCVREWPIWTLWFKMIVWRHIRGALVMMIA